MKTGRRLQRIPVRPREHQPKSRLDKLNDHVAAVTTHLSRNLDSFEKVERQGSYALRTIIKPKEKREYDADILLFMEYQPGKKPADYINDAYNCLREHGTYRDMAHRKTRCVMVDLRRRLPLGRSSLRRNQRPTLHLQQRDQPVRNHRRNRLPGTGSTRRLKSPTATSSGPPGC